MLAAAEQYIPLRCQKPTAPNTINAGERGYWHLRESSAKLMTYRTRKHKLVYCEPREPQS